MKKAGLRIGATGCALCVGWVGLVAQAQDQGGLVATIDIFQGVEITDNEDFVADPDGTSAIAQTRLGFGLTSETRSERFSFQASGEFDFGFFAQQDGFDAEVNDPSVSLFYERRSARAAVTAQGSVSQSDVSSLTGDLSDPSSLVLDTGTRLRFSTALSAQSGIDGPLTLGATLSYSGLDYSGTTNPTLVDETRRGIALSFGAQVSPVAELTGNLSFERFDADNAVDTQRDTTRASLGVIYAINPSLTADARIGTTRVETTETVGLARLSVIEDGPTFGFGLTRQLRDGQIEVDLDRSISSTGARDTLSLGRDIDLRNGQFAVSIGLSDSDGVDPSILLGLRYGNELPGGILSFSLSQVAFTDDDSNQLVTTRATMGFARELNAVSDLSAGVSFSQNDYLTGTESDVERVTVSLTYSRALTDDWDLRAGVEHARRTTVGEPLVRENKVFFGIDRSFAFRP